MPADSASSRVVILDLSRSLTIRSPMRALSMLCPVPSQCLHFISLRSVRELAFNRGSPTRSSDLRPIFVMGLGCVHSNTLIAAP